MTHDEKYQAVIERGLQVFREAKPKRKPCACIWDLKKVIVHRLGRQHRAFRRVKVSWCAQHEKGAQRGKG